MLNTIAPPAPFVVRHVELVANLASGGVPQDAAQRAEEVLAPLGIKTRVQAPEPADIATALQRAVDAGPDVLVVLAGDGTARAAAELCGPDGPVLAPLPGGTMNMLPRALYGDLPWEDALSEALAHGKPRMLGGGEVEGRTFLVAAVIGAPALWAPAREALRQGQAQLAFLRAQRAFQRAFTGRLRYELSTGARGKSEALALICPQASQALADEDAALECAVLDPAGAAQAFRLGVQAMLGDWRDDPSVEVARCQSVRVWAADRIPALLDGESVRLERIVDVRYRPQVVRALALPAKSA